MEDTQFPLTGSDMETDQDINSCSSLQENNYNPDSLSPWWICLKYVVKELIIVQNLEVPQAIPHSYIDSNGLNHDTRSDPVLAKASHATTSGF